MPTTMPTTTTPSVTLEELTPLRQLGHGSFFEVMLVEDARGRRFALKRPLPSPRPEPLLRLLADEGRVCAQLHHPHIPRLIAAFPTEGALVFELLDGTTLDEIVGEGAAVPVADAAFVVLVVLDALGYVHALDDHIVHRDIGPHNVMVTRSGDIAVIDFGIAVDDDRERWTATGALRGTLGYLSPEAVRGDVVDARADLFAATALFYRLVVGRPPFTGRGPRPILNAVARGAFTAVDDAGLHAFFARGLHPDPAQRFRDADDAAHAVRALVAAHGARVDAPAARRAWAARVAPRLSSSLTGRGPTLT
jgi:serine/threonine-protein kinase